MSVKPCLESFFKPETRKSGSDLLLKGAVSISTAGDSQVQGFIKGTPPSKVTLFSQSIASKAFTATCSCSTFAKNSGQFCKHIWALILLVGQKFPDFLDSKMELEKGNLPIQSEKRKPAKDNEHQANAKLRAAEYRKAQYEKQKELRRDNKKRSVSKLRDSGQNAKQDPNQKSKLSVFSTPLPEEVTAAFLYFSQNGFDLPEPVDIERLRNAKKLLARVFHPDKGGTHEEILELNINFDALVKFHKDQ